MSELTSRQRLFPDGDPIGRFVELGVRASGKEQMAEVVAAVGDVLYSRPDAGVMAEAYYYYRELPESFGNVTVRTEGDPLSFLPTLREAVASVDPNPGDLSGRDDGRPHREFDR